MSKGALLFAYNTSETNYFKQAEISAKRINYFLDLPVTVITDENSLPQNPNNVFDHIIITDSDKSNQLRKKVWINKNRFKAFELSPYNETLLLDTDYLVNSDKLIKTFSLNTDFCCHEKIMYLMDSTPLVEEISNLSYKTCWATVINFKKTNKVKQIFDTMEMIQNNYVHYSHLHNFVSQPYRNDFSLTLAKQIVNGHIIDSSEIIPWTLVHIADGVTVYKNNNNFYDTQFTLLYDTMYRGKHKKEYLVIKDMDFHMLNKNNYMELFVE